MTDGTLDGAPAPDGITLYGTSWCPDSRRSRALLDGLAVAYRYLDLDRDEDALAWANAQNNGRRGRAGRDQIVRTGLAVH